jgi:hypothetical protein
MAKSLKITTLAAAIFGLGLFMTVPSEAATVPIGKALAPTTASAEAPIYVGGGWNGGYGWNGGGCWRPACGWGYRRWGYRRWGYGYAGYGYRRPFPYYNYAYSYAPPVVAVPVIPVVPVVPYAPPVAVPFGGGYPYGGFGVGY